VSDQGTERPDEHASAPSPIPVTAPRVRRSGTAIGVVLIVLGAIMLFGRYLPSFDLFRLWPLIIVGGGVAEIIRGRGEPALKRVAEGVGTIAVGLVLLGNTFGYLPWTAWITMLSLWPLALVALGIELLGRGLGLTWVRALSNVVLLLGLFYGAFVLQPGTVGLRVPGIMPAGSPYSATQPHDSAVRDGSVTVKVGATRLGIGAGSDLARISGASAVDGVPTLTKTVASGVADVTVDDASGRTVVVGLTERTMELALDDSVTWKHLELDVGAVQADADLSGLIVKSVSANVGASDLRITIGGRSNDVNVDISGGVANVTLRIPESSPVTVDSKSGLSLISVPPAFRRLSGVPILGESSWKSDGSGGPRIAVSMQSGVSNLTIETYRE
jgi:hypothetical protein